MGLSVYHLTVGKSFIRSVRQAVQIWLQIGNKIKNTSFLFL